mmetsp:Transcript_77816/g.166834  ORF Transcript_77816/g.166834 Transcript_77816/m.166834 type:complete len:254 (+) Transcript_77816:916-1677(+)
MALGCGGVAEGGRRSGGRWWPACGAHHCAAALPSELPHELLQAWGAARLLGSGGRGAIAREPDPGVRIGGRDLRIATSRGLAARLGTLPSVRLAIPGAGAVSLPSHSAPARYCYALVRLPCDLGAEPDAVVKGSLGGSTATAWVPPSLPAAMGLHTRGRGSARHLLSRRVLCPVLAKVFANVAAANPCRAALDQRAPPVDLHLPLRERQARLTLLRSSRQARRRAFGVHAPQRRERAPSGAWGAGHRTTLCGL